MILDQVIPRLKNTEKPLGDAPSMGLGEPNNDSPSQKKNKFFFNRRRVKRKDSSMKSVVKAISWRVIGSLDTMVISYLITRRLSFAISIGGIEVFSKIILYYIHERVWMKIHI